MNVFSMHESLPGFPDFSELANIWKESWKKYGWNPVLMKPSYEEDDTFISDLRKKVDLLPSVNPTRYRTNNVTRWAHFFREGGGLMVDLDTINTGFTPEDLGRLTMRTARDTINTLTLDHCPCAVFASRVAIIHFIEYVYEVSGSPEAIKRIKNCSDQQMLRDLESQREGVVEGFDVCRHYGNPGWREAPLIHFGTSPILKFGAGKTKTEVIKDFLTSKA